MFFSEVFPAFFLAFFPAFFLGAALGCSQPLAAGGDTGWGDSAASVRAIAASPWMVLEGGTVLTPSGPVAADLEVRGGRIVAIRERAGRPERDVDSVARIGPAIALEERALKAVRVDIAGKWVAPSFIDSHVHLAYLPEGETLADHGIAAAVDMAAPESFLAVSHAPLELIASGPMVTAVGGYPTQSWGRDGYGYACADGAAAVAAVDRLVEEGARLIKLPVTGEPGDAQLDGDALYAAVAEAHRLGVPVASHALSDDEAARAAAAGVDVLAHTPTGTLSASTVQAWSGKTVVTTLVAFGASATTRGNLAALRAAGARVLYGTDFGNAQEAGINAQEIAAMRDSGMDGQAILDAGTVNPARFWGFSDIGMLEAGNAASFLVLDGDPLVDPAILAHPDAVYLRGARR